MDSHERGAPCREGNQLNSTDSADSWQRLGALLKQRRVTLDPRWHNRGAFSEATGLTYRLVYDIEEARRTNFGGSTLSAIEVAYRLTPGAISRFLASGDLEAPLSGTEPRAAVTVLPTAAVMPPSQAAESLWGQEVLAAAQPYALKVAFRLLELRNQGTPNPDGTQMFGTWDEWDDPRAIGWWDKNREDLDDQDLVWLIARMRAKRDRGARRNSGSALPRPPRRHLDAPLPVGGWRTSVTETAGAALDSSRA